MAHPTQIGQTARVRQRVRSPCAVIAAALTLTVVIAGTVLYAKARTDAGTRRQPATQRAPTRHVAPFGVLRVAGNQLMDANGAPVWLYGVNRSGTEFACVQGWGIFSGPTDDASVQQLVAAHVHAVRLPLNEDCWLGINGDIERGYIGAPYRSEVTNYVSRLVAHRIYAILDLHWVAAGTTTAKPSQRMPDADHGIAFWQDVARAFANQPGVLFDLYNEPHDVDWGCWKSGLCTKQTGYAAAGMQQLLDTVRGTGAHNVVLVEGVRWANDLTGLLANWPSDLDHNLVASAHIYVGNECQDTSCWQSQMGPVAAMVPLVIGEFGPYRYNNSALDLSAGNTLVTWADTTPGVAGYLAWTWNVGFGITSLLADPDGTNLTPYGQWMVQHFAALDGAHQPAPQPTASPGGPRGR